MLSKICPVVASDQYAEKELSPNTLHLGPSPSIISKTAATGLIHYSEVHIARLGDLFIERHKIIHTIISPLSRPTNYWAWADYVPERQRQCPRLVKNQLGSPNTSSYVREETFAQLRTGFTQVFVDSAFKQLTMALSQAANLLRPHNLLGDLTDDRVNNFVFLWTCKSPSRAMCTSL